ncbi:MAG: response regulator [Candidatus Altiarchaeales archaeon]|nr:response regulator [Candidatus Altiarchaeales archaeon]
MKKIFIVDDDTAILEVTKTVLKKKGFEVETASTGQQALEKIGQFKPDLMLLDIMMPEMPPKKIIENIRSRGLEVKIIYFSALKKENEIEKHLRQDLVSEEDKDYVVGYLEKPFTTDALLKKISNS